MGQEKAVGTGPGSRDDEAIALDLVDELAAKAVARSGFDCRSGGAELTI